ncbi:MAG: hypothetical protein WAP03_25425 [Methylorubrum rhodinum]|uniref:hypothetical protein n=1 Tax=Methylorubrum rhodinum TaxID=29428 RepID=UPI003BB0A4A7
MRGTGKTKAMVEGLPEGGSIVIVHHGASADYVRRMIRDLRGRHVEAATTVRAVTSRFEADRVLRGMHRRVFIDHAFEDCAERDVRLYTADLARHSNARAFA